MDKCLLLAKCKQGQQEDGVQNGPDYLKKYFINRYIGINIQTIETDTFDIIQGYIQLYHMHNTILKQKDLVITLGGDHSIGHSTVASSIEMYGDDVLILWIDAHGDINTMESSKSKNTHGMPLAGLIGLEDAWFPEIKIKLKPSNLVYFGVSDLDEYETNIIKEYNIKIAKLSELKDIIENYKYVHISFDVDALLEKYLDATGLPAKRGLVPNDIIECINYVGKKLIAIDITEFNPSKGNLQKSLDTINKIFENL